MARITQATHKADADMNRLLLLALVLLFLCTNSSFSDNTHGNANPQKEMGFWFGNLTSPYIASGCLPTVPSSSLTLTAFACSGYVEDSTGAFVYVTQAAATLTLANTNGVHWLAISQDTSSAVASWSRRAGSHYLFRQTTNKPANPPGGVVFAKVTVAGSVITAVQDYRLPASYARAGIYDITDPLYGAIGDGTTDAASALETALNAPPAGGIVFVPGGIFSLSRNVFVTRSNITVQGLGADSILKAAAGFTNTSNRGMVTFGLTSASAVSAISNLTIRDVTFDGTSLAKPLEVTNLTTGLLHHIQALNAGPTHGAIFTYDTTDLVIDSNVVSGALGEFGDGIYLGGNQRARVVNNTIYNFTRLGIVSEAGTTVPKSQDVYIAGNVIRHAHNATVAEHNGGIWVENTCGAIIVGNAVSDMTNTPGANSTNGITASSGSGGGCEWSIAHNQVSGAERGLQLQPAATDFVRVLDLSVNRGTLTDYKFGVVVEDGFDVTLDAIHLGPNNFNAAGRSGINVSIAGGVTINTLTIANSTVDPTSLYIADTGTLTVSSIGTALTHLTLHNLQGWTVVTGATPTNMMVSNSRLLYRQDSAFTAVYPLQATNFFMVNSVMTRNTGAGANQKVFKIQGGGFTYHFQNVEFVDLAANWDDSSGGAASNIFYDGCRFTSTNFQLFGGNINLSVQNSTFYENTVTGAIHGNQRNNTLNIVVSNSVFNNTDVTLTPVIQGTFAPTSTKLWNNIFATTLQTTVATAVETTNQAVLAANLGTRGSGSQVYCSDCGAAADPCAGAGTGALAFRANGRWYCP